MPLEFSDNAIGALERDLGNISLKLNLYLNAGLVVSSAFSMLAEAAAGSTKTGDRLICYVWKDSVQRNVPFESSLMLAAKNIKSRGLLRFASLVTDNKNKGSELAAKLERERRQSENERLGAAKARAKEAETKLCFPLMLLLIALVAICVLPAIISIQ